jgi:hypothetical protein
VEAAGIGVQGVAASLRVFEATQPFVNRLMRNLTHTLDPCIPFELAEDVPLASCSVGSHGFLGAFLCDPEVFGDRMIYAKFQPWDTKTLGEYRSRIDDRYSFVASPEGDCVSLSPLREPAAGIV